jgi:serine/threonine protein kinase
MDWQNLDPKRTQVTLKDKYVLKERVGSGSFGQIFSAVNQENNARIAVKFEKRSPNATLVREAKAISDLRGLPGFPSLYDYGKEDDYNYIIISLLGFNLEKLFKMCHQRFSLKTVLMIADQLISRIETLHNKNYIHRDIKPENFCIGKANSNRNIFLIDFGLAKSYKDANEKHISMKEGKGLIGTARYASVNAHLGLEQGRRDDLEAIGYTLIYFLLGKLPWQNLKVDEKQQKYQKICELKMRTPVDQLCEGLPSQFAAYLNYVKNLEFDEDPDYKYLKKLFRTLFVENGYDFDYNYDWVDLTKTHFTVDTANSPQGKLKEPLFLEENTKEHTRGTDLHKTHNYDASLLSPQCKQDKHKDALSPSKLSKQEKLELSPRQMRVSPRRSNSKQEEGSQNADKRYQEPMENKVKPVIIPKTTGKYKTLNKLIPASASGSREGSPRKYDVPESLTRKMSSDSLYSVKDINRSENEDVPEEVTQNDSIGSKVGKMRQLSVMKKGVSSRGSEEIPQFMKNSHCLGTNTLYPGRNSMSKGTMNQDLKKSPFLTSSMLDSKRVTSRTRDSRVYERKQSEEDEGNLNDSSICEWKGTNNLDLMISQKRFFVRSKKQVDAPKPTGARGKFPVFKQTLYG